MIELENVVKRYQNDTVPAVDGVSLRAEAGELIALLGESGCGKTTTLKMINRLIEPTRGTIRLGGGDVSEQDAVLGHWGRAATWSTGDFDLDGVVAQGDLDVVLTGWGTSASRSFARAPSSVVPEPMSMGLIGSLWVGLLGRREPSFCDAASRRSRIVNRNKSL